MSATETFFKDFFPAAAAALERHKPLWNLLQPPWLAAACPEQQLALPLPHWLGSALQHHGSGAALLVRNPSLLPAQLAGLTVALHGICSLRGARLAYLRHSLLFFGLMNARWVLAGAAPRAGRRSLQLSTKIACNSVVLTVQFSPTMSVGAASVVAVPTAAPGEALLPCALHRRVPNLEQFCRQECCKAASVTQKKEPRSLTRRSSVVAHAFAQRGTPLWQAALQADIAFTGASSLCLLLWQVRGAGGLRKNNTGPSDA